MSDCSQFRRIDQSSERSAWSRRAATFPTSLLDQNESLVVAELPSGVLEVPGVLWNAKKARQSLGLISVEVIWQAEALIGIVRGHWDLPRRTHRRDSALSPGSSSRNT